MNDMEWRGVSDLEGPFVSGVNPVRADVKPVASAEAAMDPSEAIAVAEKPGLLDPLRKIFGETKAKRDARIKRERRATA